MINTPPINDPKGEAGSKKAPMWLLPPVALEQTAWVHKLGSDKYGRLVLVPASSCGEELVDFCSCGYTIEKQPATQTDLTPPGACASSVTSSSTPKPGAHLATQEESFGRVGCASLAITPSCSGRTPSMPSDSAKTTPTGSPTTTTGTWSEPENVGSALRYGPGTAPTAEPRHCLRTGSPSTTSAASLQNKGGVESAGDLQGVVGSTSTTTTRPSSSGGSSAIDATRDLASSEIIEKLLRKHSPTCNARSLQIRDGHVWQRGDFNWRRTGVCATTYVSAIMRHLNAWRDGEDLDPESGISHIAHIATSCNILMDAAACGTLQDDRNKRVASLSQEAAFRELAAGMPGGEPPEESAYDFLMRNVLTPKPTPAEQPSLTQVEVGGRLVDLPPVPEGYDRWEDRGTGWDSGDKRVACFAARFAPSPTIPWHVYHNDTANGVSCSRYLEAVKNAPEPTTAAVQVVDHDIAVGDTVRVNPVFADPFIDSITSITESRGGKIFRFERRGTFGEDEIHSITLHYTP